MHYLIDLDNTLLTTFFFDKDNNVNFYWSQNFKNDFGQSPRILKDLFCEPFLTMLRTNDDLRPYVNTFLQKHNLKITAEEFLEYWLSRDSQINPDVLDWIRKHHNPENHFHIASNQPNVRMNYIWEHRPELHEFFENIFISANIGTSKPDPVFFIKIQQKLKVPFSEICLIDDEPKNIQSAKTLGMQTVLFNSTNDLPK